MSPSELPFAYAVDEFTTTPWSFEEDLHHYPRLGVEAIELCEAKLDERRAHEQLAALSASGLRVCSVQPAVRTLLASRMMPEPADPRHRLDRLRRTIERIAPYAPGAPFVVNTGPAPGGDMAAALDRIEEGLAALTRFAADHGVRVALEPLHPVMLNVETAVWTFSQAVRLVERVDVDGLGVCADLWNLWQEPGLAEAMRSAADRIALLQVSDWRTPRSHADRRSVGTGDIPMSRLLHAAFDTGYRGPCVLEIFSQDVPDSLYDGDLAALITDNHAALRRAWNDPR
ncbi:sugar phosphate isomerase/epimerase family protein [Thermomonospora umbrina]|uniref:Sugar phosphate isomerase/epimerase n=1 Tax=Thermomonospora umbrina TaxID=111806 RepID=A0A3D9SW90_9ACTN|nr:sugar phosphate isomerase/epimerase family protein [Thermomonospora umbrina]REE99867.1 sugar phosphate isomerase/epimerase [Thermomonospora umbrina]